MRQMRHGNISFNGSAIRKSHSFSFILQFMTVCMIVSTTHPQTTKWMKVYMETMILILETVLLNDKTFRTLFKKRGLTLAQVLDGLKNGFVTDAKNHRNRNFEYL